MIFLCLIIVFFATLLVTTKAIFSSDIFTKILLLNVSTSLGALFICFLGSLQVNSSYLDIALIYFLLSVVATNAYLKYFLNRHKEEITNNEKL